VNTVLNVVGIALQAAGVLLAAWGTLRTWRDFGPEEGITEPIRRRLRAARRRLGAWLDGVARCVFRRRGRGVVAHAGVAQGLAMVSGHARVRKGYGVLAKGTGVSAALQQLDDRTRELMELVNDRSDELEDGLTALRKELQESSKHLEDADAALAKVAQRVATDGIRIGMFGLVLVGIGLLLQGMAVVV
jgi:hypothetical protein